MKCDAQAQIGGVVRAGGQASGDKGSVPAGPCCDCRRSRWCSAQPCLAGGGGVGIDMVLNLEEPQDPVPVS